MMGRLNHDQGQLFYSFCLEEAVPDDHLVRKVAALLDLSWVHAELAPHYPDNGRPSIDPRADDPHADHWLCVRYPLGASAVPGCASEPGLSLVLWTFN
jgi:hypothetical protein